MGPGMAGEVGPQGWGTGRGGSLCPGLFHPNLPAVPSCLGEAGGRCSVSPPWSKESPPLPVSPEAHCEHGRPPAGKEALGLSFGSDGGPGATGVVGDVLRR